jgi:hypothetical protein
LVVYGHAGHSNDVHTGVAAYYMKRSGVIHALEAAAAMLLDVIVIDVHCGALDIARSLEHQRNFYCVFVPISRGFVFAASGVHVRDSPRHCICEFGTLGAHLLNGHGRHYNADAAWGMLRT